MSEFLRDMLLRSVIAAFVAAIVGGGVVWIAFDQSLRGLETAVTVTNDRVSGVDAQLLKIDGSIDRSFDRIQNSLLILDAKLDANGAQLSEISQTGLTVWAENRDQDADLLSSLELLKSVMNTDVFAGLDEDTRAEFTNTYLTICNRTAARFNAAVSRIILTGSQGRQLISNDDELKCRTVTMRTRNTEQEQ